MGLTASALRFHDDCDLLRPTRVDPASGYRWYAVSQEPRARLLRSADQGTFTTLLMPYRLAAQG